MGRWVSAGYGYGIVLPTEDDEFDHTRMADYLQEFVEVDDEEGYDYATIEWWDVINTLQKKYDLESDSGGTEEYSEYVLHARGYHNSFDAVSKFDNLPDNPTDEQVSNLRAAAKDLGLDFSPGWFLVASYG